MGERVSRFGGASAVGSWSRGWVVMMWQIWVSVQWVGSSCSLRAMRVVSSASGCVGGVTQADYLGWMRSCTLVSATGLPALSLPAARTPAGSPVGLQIIGHPGPTTTSWTWLTSWNTGSCPAE